MTKSAKPDTGQPRAQSATTEPAITEPATTEPATIPDDARPEPGPAPAAGAGDGTSAAEAAQPDLDETKRRFREALERKHQAHNDAQGQGNRDGGKINGSQGPAASRRNFRRRTADAAAIATGSGSGRSLRWIVPQRPGNGLAARQRPCQPGNGLAARSRAGAPRAPGRTPPWPRYHCGVGISSPNGLVIAIDGPSGSGKSSASKGAARELGLRYLDTGAMYRALTWWFMSENADTADSGLVAARAAEPAIEVCTDPDRAWTRVNGRDVSADIRTPEVSAQVSVVARVPAVREHLIAMQRAIIAAAAPGIVAEGRDIGTVVAPAAQLKVFLTADPGARARRRAAELGGDAGETEAAQDRRDRLDAAQSQKAADALLVDATDLTLEQVIGAITRLARERGELACAGNKSI